MSAVQGEELREDQKTHSSSIGSVPVELRDVPPLRWAGIVIKRHDGSRESIRKARDADRHYCSRARIATQDDGRLHCRPRCGLERYLNILADNHLEERLDRSTWGALRARSDALCIDAGLDQRQHEETFPRDHVPSAVFSLEDAHEQLRRQARTDQADHDVRA